MHFSCSNRALTGFYLLLSSLFLLNSCTETEGVTPNANSVTLIKPRGPVDILPDSLFELHNDFILWVFANHKDSAEYYLSDLVDFMGFTSRKWFAFTGEVADVIDLVLDNDTLILAEPYYTYNEGFTNESLIAADWSSTEYGYLYTVLDSVYDAIDNNEPEVKIQQLISNGKSRISAINPENENALLNVLTQGSYSLALGYELNDTYGGGDPQPFINCLIFAAYVDIEAMHLYQRFGEGGAAANMDAIASISITGFLTCL